MLPHDVQIAKTQDTLDLGLEQDSEVELPINEDANFAGLRFC